MSTAIRKVLVATIGGKTPRRGVCIGFDPRLLTRRPVSVVEHQLAFDQDGSYVYDLGIRGLGLSPAPHLDGNLEPLPGMKVWRNIAQFAAFIEISKARFQIAWGKNSWDTWIEPCGEDRPADGQTFFRTFTDAKQYLIEHCKKQARDWSYLASAVRRLTKRETLKR